MSRKTRKSKVKRYPTDLNDKKWDIINPLLPGALLGGRPRKISVRKLINAILYVTRSGCAWRLLPHGLPPWQTVYGLSPLDKKWRVAAYSRQLTRLGQAKSRAA